MRWVALVAVVVVLLAGCTTGNDPARTNNDEDAASTTSARGSEPELGTAARENRSVLRFAQGSIAQASRWINGTFQPHEACNLTGCTTGAAFHEQDLTGLLPPDAPARIRLQLDYSTGIGVFGAPLQLLLLAGDATIYDLQFDRADAGQERLEAVLWEGSDPIIAAVLNTWPTGASNHYTLHIQVEADPTRLPAGVPVEVDLEPGQRIEMARLGGDGNLQLALYAPDDRLQDRWQASGVSSIHQLPTGAPPGPWVLVVPTGAPDLQISTEGNATSMRPLRLQQTLGEAHPATPGEPAEWSFDLDGHPLAVGLYAQPQAGPWAKAGEDRFQLSGPGGAVLDAPWNCICIGLVDTEPVVAARSATAAPGLVPGTYTATFETSTSAGLQVGHLVTTYTR